MMPHSSCVVHKLAGAGGCVPVMVRSLLEGLYLSDPEPASCQMGTGSLCSGYSWRSSERRAGPCDAQQGASLNVFQQKHLLMWVKGTWLITTLYETALLVFVGISTYWTHFSQLCNGWSPWAQQLLGECHGPLYCARGEIVWCHCWCGLPGFWFTEGSENSEQPNCTFPGRGSSTSKP